MPKSNQAFKSKKCVRKITIPVLSSAITASSAALISPGAAAQSVVGTWNGQSGIWSDPLKWTGSIPGSGTTVPPGQDDVANFLAGLTSASTISLSDSRTIGTLHFDSKFSYTLSGTSTLSFNASGGGSASLLVTANNGIAAQTVNVPLILQSPLNIAAASAGASLNLNNSISDNAGGFGLTLNGPGTVTLGGSGVNSYTGPTTVNSGTVILNRAGLSIPGNLTIGTGSSAATVRFMQSNLIANDADVTVVAGPTSATDGGVLDLEAALNTIGSLAGSGLVKGTGLKIAGAKSTTFDGTFQFGDFYKTGPSTLTLNSSNKFVSFTLSGGTVVLGNDGALGNATLFLNNSNFLPTATGSGNIVLQASAPRVLNNNAIAIGTVNFGGTAPMTFGSLELTGNLSAEVDADTTFNGTVTATGNYGLTKTGPGTLTIGLPDNKNTYTGPTIVNGGTLKLANAGSTDSTSSYTVNNGTLDFSAGGTNVTLAVNLTGNSGTVVGSLVVLGSISGTNLTLGDLRISSTKTNPLTGTLTVGNLSGLSSVPVGTVIGGNGTVSVATIMVVDGEVDKPFSVNGSLLGQGKIGGPVDVYQQVKGNSGVIGGGPFNSQHGTLTTGDLTVELGAIVETGIGGTNNSTINVNGSINLAGLLLVQPYGAPDLNTTFVILNNDGVDPITGHFENLPTDGSVLTVHFPGVDYLYTIDYHYDAAGDGANNDIALKASAVATPEPGTMSVACIAAITFLSRRTRRKIAPHPANHESTRVF